MSTHWPHCQDRCTGSLLQPFRFNTRRAPCCLQLLLSRARTPHCVQRPGHLFSFSFRLLELPLPSLHFLLHLLKLRFLARCSSGAVRCSSCAARCSQVQFMCSSCAARCSQVKSGTIHVQQGAVQVQFRCSQVQSDAVRCSQVQSGAVQVQSRCSVKEWAQISPGRKLPPSLEQPQRGTLAKFDLPLWLLYLPHELHLQCNPICPSVRPLEVPP